MKKLILLIVALTSLQFTSNAYPSNIGAHYQDREGYYKVKEGDTLDIVSQKTGVSVSDLMRFNGIYKSKSLRTGQVLRLKPLALKK